MDSLEDWLTMLALHPDDWDAWSVFADWLEDGSVFTPDGLFSSAAARWVVIHKKRPYNSSARAAFSWFDASKVEPGLGDPESDLPGPVYAALTGGTVAANHRTYETCRDALYALLAAIPKDHP